ncbi:hypothetical protein [Nitrososphaera sp.]|uniref:hypothetical protein n=1 Tax=Nitrososphaera sp. TaxID=1971748 RepID=UPI003170718E
MTAGAVAAGFVVGIAFLIIFAVVRIPPHPILATSWAFPDLDDYLPLLQIRIDGLKEVYSVGEKLDFAVAQKGGGYAYPEMIMIKDLERGGVVWEFNGTQASFLLFCTIVTNYADFEITWHSRDIDLLVMNQTGTYAVVAKNEHLTVQKEFVVVG